MKTLLILRHAKSSWDDSHLSDHERPLNQRGKRDAPRMGRLLRDEDLIPDLIITSTAKRAQSTAQAVAKASGYQGTIEKTRAFYHATPDEYLSVLGTLTLDANRVMIVGHNPGMADLVAQLAGHAEAMPTASLAHIELPIDAWTDLEDATQGELVHIWRPKELS